jgi:hypothetical protein
MYEPFTIFCIPIKLYCLIYEIKNISYTIYNIIINKLYSLFNIWNLGGQKIENSPPMFNCLKKKNNEILLNYLCISSIPWFKLRLQITISIW